VIKYVFVIAMENHDASQIYGNTASAPYINGILIPQYARATNFIDELPALASEPHYLWMDGGTNAYPDHTFTTDDVPSASNSTSSTAHLVTQIENATNGVTWITYQEGLDAATGTCPIAKSGFYFPKHDPFIFFQDVSGSPPSKTNSYCTAHHRPYSRFTADLSADAMANYVFITPNQCHDMHGQSRCRNKDTIRAGDDWLSTELPRIISFVNASSGVVFLTWDEPGSGTTMPFLAIGPGVKANYAGSVAYTHSALVKSAEAILGVPILPTVAGSDDLADLFGPGSYP
jgi:hypothetical protein